MHHTLLASSTSECHSPRFENGVLLVCIPIDDQKHYENVLLKEAADDSREMASVVRVDAGIGNDEAYLQRNTFISTAS